MSPHWGISCFIKHVLTISKIISNLNVGPLFTRFSVLSNTVLLSLTLVEVKVSPAMSENLGPPAQPYYDSWFTLFVNYPESPVLSETTTPKHVSKPLGRTATKVNPPNLPIPTPYQGWKVWLFLISRIIGEVCQF